MAVLNKRNAILGWAVWQTATRVAKHKAKGAISNGHNSHPRRKRIAAGAALAAAGGALLFWRQKGSGNGSPPAE
jgi:hypothetical protein